LAGLFIQTNKTISLFFLASEFFLDCFKTKQTQQQLVCGAVLSAVYVVKFLDGTLYPIEWYYHNIDDEFFMYLHLKL
jgi:hypothetical protein